MEKKKKIQWSKYQKAVFDFIESTDKSLVVNAVAGSGKTTTIVEAARIASKKGSVLFLAFNKSIATELAERMEGTGIECKTLHSHGFRAIMKSKVKTDKDKWMRYLKENSECLFGLTADDIKDIDKYQILAKSEKLLNLCRINLVKGGDMPAIENVAEHHGIEVTDTQMSAVSDCLRIAYKFAETIDFTDMITLPAVNPLAAKNLPKYKTVFVDECQDLSLAQRQLLMNSVEEGGRFIAVGDRNQAINGFAGADSESFEALAALAGNELPLSCCYRCGSDIVGLAKELVPQIECGIGTRGEVANAKSLEGVRYGDMVLCRKTAPLVSVCLKLLANGINAHVKGREIVESLKSMVKKTKKGDVTDMLIAIDKEKDSVIRRQMAKGRTRGEAEDSVAYSNVCDKVACIEAIAETCVSVQEVLEKVDRIFSEHKNGNTVTLSTVHKAKGLEADNVFIICPECMPLTFKKQQQWQYQQELNIKYVAITRAKKRLTFVDVECKKIGEVQVPKRG